MQELSDRLKSFARQNKYLQDCRHVCCQNIIFFAKIHRKFVRLNVNVFTGQNENLPVLSGSPALFVKTHIALTQVMPENREVGHIIFKMIYRHQLINFLSVRFPM